MISFAIIGIGHISRKHADAIEQIEGAELTAVCDANPDRLEPYIGKLGTYTDLEEMLRDNKQIDVVNICVPSGLHAGMTKLAASYGKHIIVEKPMALTVEDARDMIQAAKDNYVKLSVVHPNRYRPAVIELKKAIDQERFGKLSHVNASVRWNRNQAYYDQSEWRGTKAFDGGVLMNQAIHNLDLMLWMAGPVESVQAEAATRIRDIEAEDVAAAVVRFKNGALGIIEAATTIYPENLEESISVFGEKASAKISGKTANHIETWDVEGLSGDEKLKLIERVTADPFGKPGHQAIIEDMVRAIEEGREPTVSGEQGLAPILLISAILESAETGKRVKLSGEGENQ